MFFSTTARINLARSCLLRAGGLALSAASCMPCAEPVFDSCAEIGVGELSPAGTTPSRVTPVHPLKLCVVSRQPGDITLWGGEGSYYEVAPNFGPGKAFYGPILSYRNQRGGVVQHWDGSCQFMWCEKEL